MRYWGMIIHRPSHERGHADFGWLDTHHSFSFGDYNDPQWMGFRSLRVINDDRLAAGQGFGMHPHRDMEIISFVVEGALEHRDSMGNGRVIRTDEFQYMSAGSGVRHSEFNPSKTETGRFLQIWIQPAQRGLEPRYSELSMAGIPNGTIKLAASGNGRDGSIEIRQDADLWYLKLNANQTHTQALKPGRHAWLQVVTGTISAAGKSLAEGDGLAVSNESALEIIASTEARVLLFDLA